MSFFVSFLNAFHLASYREKHNRLSSFCPWAFFVGKYGEGIVLLKGGALMRTYSFVCSDLGSASVESINAVSFFFNEAIKRLGNGWCPRRGPNLKPSGESPSDLRSANTPDQIHRRQWHTGYSRPWPQAVCPAGAAGFIGKVTKD